MKSKLFLKYAGMIMMLGGMVWFYYLYSSAESRMSQLQKDVYRMIDSNLQVELSDATRDEIAISLLLRESADKIEDMIYPFLLAINGFTLLLFHERKKAEQVVALDG